MRDHFEGMFAKPRNRQREQVWRQLERRCKDTRWKPFSKVELALRTAAWAGSKSTGPDGASYEALTRRCGVGIREQFNDALYKGRLPPEGKATQGVAACSNSRAGFCWAG